jgi:hypothetical protein
MLLIPTGRFLKDNYKGLYTACFWEEPGQMRTTSSVCPVNRDVFETPTQRGWPIFYAFLGATFVFSHIVCRNSPRRLMQVTFWLHFLITIAIRSLSTFSGWTTQPGWSSLIWNSNSPGKICWLWLLVECGCWNWTYLGFYNDYYFHEATRTVHDPNGKAVWTFTSEKTGVKSEDEMYTPYSLMFRPWRDIAVRLSYIHLVDNTIHVIWFRYLHIDAPYTVYINNSEILTVLLFVSLTVYTYTRMRTHVYFDDNSTFPLVHTKSTVPQPVHSASRDLFNFVPQQHLFRTASEKRQMFMVFACVMVTAEIAVCELFPWIRDSWLVFICGPLSIIVRVFINSWEEYGKMGREDHVEVLSPPGQAKCHGSSV